MRASKVFKPELLPLILSHEESSNKASISTLGNLYIYAGFPKSLPYLAMNQMCIHGDGGKTFNNQFLF